MSTFAFVSFSGEQIPRVEYTKEEIKTWSVFTFYKPNTFKILKYLKLSVNEVCLVVAGQIFSILDQR